MMKRSVLILILSLGIISSVPLDVFGRSHGYPYYSPPRHHYSYRPYHHHHNDALALGLVGVIVGGVLTAAVLQPSYQQRVYVDRQYYPEPSYSAPPTRVYSYPPQIPAGMCRWERFVLDGYGRNVIDAYGQPVKEYTLGSCQYPPD